MKKLFDDNGKELDISEIIEMLSMELVHRVEVIDELGRSYVNNKSKNRVELSLQDEGRTLKIFITQ